MPRIVAGNWKMNGTRGSIEEVKDLVGRMTADDRSRVTTILCPPATLLAAVAELAGPAGIPVGGQTCHPKESGAHTGDISPEMLADAGATYCIVGHSERRADHGETNAAVHAQAEACGRAGLTPIICVGETLAEREAGNATAIVGDQLAGSIPSGLGCIVAYEPVWAIGTGVTASVADIEAMHAHIRGTVGADTPILYGGSVKPGNASDILGTENVDGALVGGASLKASDFYGIISAP